MNKPQRNVHRDSSKNSHHSRSSLAEETAPRKPSEYVFAVGLALCVIAVFQWLGSHRAPPDETPKSFSVAEAKAARVAPSDFLKALSEKVTETFPDQVGSSIGDDLLVIASDAVEQGDQALLAETMTFLGVNALRDSNTEAASVYLDEALVIFEELQDDLGIGKVELLRGELNVIRRANARRAAYAYDAMQVARWKVAQGQFHEAIDELQFAVDENLALKRYGAAAAVYQTLYKGYLNHGQLYEAQQAGMEIVRLHAASGRSLKAGSMLSNLAENGLDAERVEQLKSESLALQIEYEHSVGQLGQARDYQQLYNHFIHAGDPVRAWQFRVKAQRSLSGVSLRAMHRSQTGVLALLYTSNDHMENAKKSLSRAQGLFANHNQQHLYDQTLLLQTQSY